MTIPGGGFGNHAITRIVTAALIGGAVSKLTGGKFANGVASAAFAVALREVDSSVSGNLAQDDIEYDKSGTKYAFREDCILSDGCTVNAYFECEYNGNVAACNGLRAQNDRDLEHVLDFVEDDSPDLLLKEGGAETIGFSDTIEEPAETDWLTGEIYLRRLYPSRAKLVDTVGHELTHRSDGLAGRLLTNFQDNLV